MGVKGWQLAQGVAAQQHLKAAREPRINQTVNASSMLHTVFDSFDARMQRVLAMADDHTNKCCS